jgi:dTDP-4-dehydrorhamnose 3,5-epimerase
VQITSTKIAGAFTIDLDVHRDERGLFKEVFSQVRYAALGMERDFVQDNVSVSRPGVLRGLHYDMRMDKLVQCLQGVIFDAIVDMRESSPTFRQWDGIELSGENHRQLFVPAGCAHGFYVLRGDALVHYKQTALYDPAHERLLSWRDPAIGIAWPLHGEPLLSAKDAAG